MDVESNYLDTYQRMISSFILKSILILENEYSTDSIGRIELWTREKKNSADSSSFMWVENVYTNANVYCIINHNIIDP